MVMIGILLQHTSVICLIIVQTDIIFMGIKQHLMFICCKLTNITVTFIEFTINLTNIIFVVFKCNFKPLSLKRHFPACHCSREENHIIITSHNLAFYTKKTAVLPRCFPIFVSSLCTHILQNNLLVRTFTFLM